MILDDLADALHAADPVPAGVVAAAALAFDARREDADALERLPEPAGVRGCTSRLAFGGPGVRVDLEFSGSLDVLGLVHPPCAGTALVRWPGGSREVVVDGGWFRADGVPPGPLRVVVRAPGRGAVSTGWFVG
ncbi:hypothetical protein [Umezawaea beigongshangensis]|uniref:hypothetical protein n=1 Tax=Umezawaea beigongshangensis TaxID=2780383 RepID=UPI0018F1B07A|nr:hypothetical protein [Umezawaea beigongshangensis]